MARADVIEGLVDYVGSASTGPRLSLFLATFGRVYGLSVPAGDLNQMPRSCIVLSRVGGEPAEDFVITQHALVESLCYGSTRREAAEVDYTLHEVLMGMRDVRSQSSPGAVFFYDVEQQQGASDELDGYTRWPYVRRVYSVYYGGEEV